MDRKEKIIELIKGGYNNVKALSQYFGVSLMTIYRDVRDLEKEGKLIRKHGEIKLKTSEDTKEEKEEKNACAYCTKLVDKRLEFIYRLEDGKIKACCAHCGLLLYKNIKNDQVEVCMTWDFISGNPINCFSAWYVIGSSAIPCCSPSAIAFASKEHAENFAKGFGGVVVDFEKGVETIKEMMKRGQRVEIKTEP